MLSVELFLQNTVHRYVLPTNLLNLAITNKDSLGDLAIKVGDLVRKV